MNLRSFANITFISSLLILGVSCQEDKPKTIEAQAKITALGDSKVTGKVSFLQVKDKVKITINLKNFERNGSHGFHVHEFGDCGKEGKAAGGHFQPIGYEHGSREEKSTHAGDLGNIKVDGNGVVTTSIMTDKISLMKNEEDYIIGRSIVIHEKADDLVTQPSGQSGKRIACGVIE